MRQNRDGEQNCFRPFGRFSLLFIIVSVVLHATTFSEFKREQNSAYKAYKDERDSEFAKYLKEQWQAYKKFVSPPLYEKPKPKTVPIAKPKEVKKVGPRILIKPPKKPKIKKPSLPLDVLVEEEPVKDQKEQKPLAKPTVMPIQKDIILFFFGSKIGFDIPQKIKNARFYPTDQKGIKNYFDNAASSEYGKLLEDIKALKKSMRLNDWGVYLLVNAMAHKIYKYEDEAQLFVWFVLNKLGYAVKVGISNGRVISMFYSKKVIYATPNFRFGKKRYYVLSRANRNDIAVVYTYKQNYPEATKAIDLSLKNIPLFPARYESKNVKFTHLGKAYTITYKYNKNLIDFCATYPQADYATFFNAPLDPLTDATLISSLRTYINGKKASQAMNFVLHFVQNAFIYKTDKEQFGREKVMFAQETLFYRASDCEDRAILYAYLTKKLFGVPVLGVKYPNHMATALYVPLSGDKIRIKGKEFVIADPTYINAQIGEAMPQFKGKMPQEFIYVTLK